MREVHSLRLLGPSCVCSELGIPRFGFYDQFISYFGLRGVLSSAAVAWACSSEAGQARAKDDLLGYLTSL
jgi:hypothetical protein